MATSWLKIVLALGMISYSVAASGVADDPAEGELRDTFSLSFELATSKNGSLTFVAGYPRPGSTANPQDHYRNLSVRASALVRVLQNGLVRFTFAVPLQIKTRDAEGRESNVVYRSMDVRLNAESRAALDWMRTLKTETVLVEKRGSDSRDQIFEEVLQQSPSETLRRQFELGERMPRLYLYNGDISFGYINFDPFSRGEATDTEINRVDLKQIARFDRQRNTITTKEGGTSLPFSMATGYGRLDIFDSRVQTVLAVQQHVDEAMERAMPFRISHRMIDGRRHVVLHEPEKDANISRPNFGRVGLECAALFKQSH